MTIKQTNLVYCDFCGKHQHQVAKIIAGPKVHICDECVLLCYDIVQDNILPSHPKWRADLYAAWRTTWTIHNG